MCADLRRRYVIAHSYGASRPKVFDCKAAAVQRAARDGAGAAAARWWVVYRVVVAEDGASTMKVPIVVRVAACALALLPGCDAHAQPAAPSRAQLVPRAGVPREGARMDVMTLAQAPLFLALCALTAGAALWWVVRWRHQRAADAMRARFEATLAERMRIAQEFHDTLLQGFTGIALQLHALRVTMRSRPDDAAETVTRLAAAAEASLREARRAVWEMRAPELDELDLPDALAAAAYDVIGAAPLTFELEVRGDRRRLAREVEITVLRVGREAVANAVRHAGAHAVSISLDYGSRTLALAVRDDGFGLTTRDAATARRDGHWGIVGMRERAKRAGGTLSITSAPGTGTIVSLALPNGEVARVSHSA